MIESTSRLLKTGIVYGRAFATTEELRRELNARVWFYNNERIRTTLGMSPVEFREAGLSLQDLFKLGLHLQV